MKVNNTSEIEEFGIKYIYIISNHRNRKMDNDKLNRKIIKKLIFVFSTLEEAVNGVGEWMEENDIIILIDLDNWSTYDTIEEYTKENVAIYKWEIGEIWSLVNIYDIEGNIIE